MRPAIIAAVLAACVPASAQVEVFDIRLSCHEGVPELVGIIASGAGMIVLNVEQMYLACIESVPESKRWKASS